MSRSTSRKERCLKCRMIPSHCICEHLTSLYNVTPVSILMHYREAITTTNTGRIANYMLMQSDIHIRGLIKTPLDENLILKKGYTPLFLFPSEESLVLTSELVRSLDNKVQLIVPDGSWRQAKKVARREPFLKTVQHVKLPDTSSGMFFLRRKVKDEGVSTIEAIARALGIIESTLTQKTLENVFRIMVEKTLETRGKKLENYELHQ